MLVKMALKHQGCDVVVEVPVEDDVFARWQALADAEGQPVSRSVGDVCEGIDETIDHLRNPYFAAFTGVEFAQQLFCHATTLTWSCPWNCDNYEQSEGEFRSHIREWWAYLRATGDERERIVAAGEAALRHDGKEVRRLLGDIVDRLGAQPDDAAAL